MQKIKKIYRADPEKMRHRRTDRQTDGQMNCSDFIGTLPQRWRFMFFRNSRINCFKKLFEMIVSHIERINERKRNKNNIVQCSKSSKPIILSKFM